MVKVTPFLLYVDKPLKKKRFLGMVFPNGNFIEKINKTKFILDKKEMSYQKARGKTFRNLRLRFL